MTASEKMSYLIIDTQGKCKSKGHRMDWRRYSNFLAEAECLDCTTWVRVVSASQPADVYGSAIMSDCIHKIVEQKVKEK